MYLVIPNIGCEGYHLVEVPATNKLAPQIGTEFLCEGLIYQVERVCWERIGGANHIFCLMDPMPVKPFVTQEMKLEVANRMCRHA